MQAALFAVDKRRQPQVFSHIGAPAVEIEIVAYQGRPAIRAVDAYNVKVLIFHPDAPHEAPLVFLADRVDVKHQAAHFTQEFTPHVLDPVVQAVETVHVQENHLQESTRQEL